MFLLRKNVFSIVLKRAHIDSTLITVVIIIIKQLQIRVNLTNSYQKPMAFSNPTCYLHMKSRKDVTVTIC